MCRRSGSLPLLRSAIAIAGSSGLRCCHGAAASAAELECPYAVMGLDESASRQQIKMRYYELAKLTHPDAQAEEADDSPEPEQPLQRSFLEVHAAFEELMELVAIVTATGGAARPSARTSAGGRAAARRKAGAGASAAMRKKTLGEVLCERLKEEPHAVAEVWGDIKERQLPVVSTMLEECFRACSIAGGGLPAALGILRDATRLGLLTTQVREAALISLIKWCKEDKTSVETIMNEIGEEERSKDLMESVSYANFLYSGYADGYSGSR